MELYIQLKRDYEEAPERSRGKDFHDPRKGWEAPMRARQVEIDRLAAEAARHKWLAKWYERAYATPWCEPPPEETAEEERRENSGRTTVTVSKEEQVSHQP